MGKKEQSVPFRLMKITTEEFATIDANFKDGNKVTVTASLGFDSDPSQKVVSSIAKFEFDQKKKTFLIVAGACHFEIIDKSWKTLYNEESKNLTIPKDLATHFAMLTVGTVRGILHSETSNTKYNNYFVPTVNVLDIIKDDLVIEVSDIEI